jgi:hypothetical protein
MLGVEYFRRQARIYRRLSRLSTDREFSQKMRATAEEFRAKAEEAAERSEAPLAPVTDQDVSADTQ